MFASVWIFAIAGVLKCKISQKHCLNKFDFTVI